MINHRRPSNRQAYPARRRRNGGIRRRIVFLLLLVVLLIAALPYALLMTPLRNVALSSAVPGRAVRVTADDGAFSWIGGSSLSSVDVRDGAGDVLFEAERIAISRSPLELLFDWHDIGSIEITRPVLHVRVRPDGSNLEDVVGTFLAELAPDDPEPEPDDAEGAALRYALQLTGGTVHIEDLASSRRWRIEELNLSYEQNAHRGALGSGHASGKIVEVAAAGEIPGGRFAVAIEPDATGRNNASFQAEEISLALAEPWLRRKVVASSIRGTLSGHGTANWSGSQLEGLTTQGSLTIVGLDAAAPMLLADRLRLQRVELPWRLVSQPSGLAIEDMQLRTDLGQLALRGRLDPNFDARRHDVELRGALDLVRLAAALPSTLRIRKDTTITSGTLELSAQYKPVDGAQLITGSLRTAELGATTAGRALRWDTPVDARFAVRQSDGLIHIDTLRCDSKFLRVEGAGSAQDFTASASFDLSSLAEQLGQFVDLSGIELIGTGSANVSWQHTDANRFKALATSELTGLVVSVGEGTSWAEPQLVLRAEADGAIDSVTRRAVSVDRALLTVDGQGDTLVAELAERVALGKGPVVWPISLRGSGRVARWMTRIRPWFNPAPWQIDGDGELTASLRVSPSLFEATGTRVVVQNLRATAPGWNIQEQRVEVAGDARWNGESRELLAQSTQLVSSTVSLATRDVRVRIADSAPIAVSGAGAFRTDLARLARWKATTTADGYRPGGHVSGSVRFAQDGAIVRCDLNVTGEGLTLARRDAASADPTTVWQEAKATLGGAGVYDTDADSVVLERLDLQSTTLTAAASGKITAVSTTPDVAINGTVNYDLAQVTPLLRPYLGNGIELKGREQARFALAGTLAGDQAPRAQLVSTTPYSVASATRAMHWSRRVRAEVDLPWSGATVFGLPIGAGRLSTKLGDGSLQVEPLALAVGEGRLTAAPRVQLDPEPAEVVLPPGPLVTNVRISPEVSEAMLKYVAPVLAGATQSEGVFSLVLENTRVPLAETKRMTSAGRLTVHSVQVVPGPMVRQWVSLAQQIEALAKRRDPSALVSRPPVTLLAVRDQQVSFRVVDGRVHHQAMEFQVGDVVMRSQGSVGLDETLALSLQVPIQDAWIAKEPLLAGLKGQALVVPVTGTLTRPQLDQRAIASLSAQLIQSAAGQAISGELNNALDRLFNKRQPDRDQ